MEAHQHQQQQQQQQQALAVMLNQGGLGMLPGVPYPTGVPLISPYGMIDSSMLGMQGLALPSLAPPVPAQPQQNLLQSFQNQFLMTPEVAATGMQVGGLVQNERPASLQQGMQERTRKLAELKKRLSALSQRFATNKKNTSQAVMAVRTGFNDVKGLLEQHQHQDQSQEQLGDMFRNHSVDDILANLAKENYNFGGPITMGSLSADINASNFFPPATSTEPLIQESDSDSDATPDLAPLEDDWKK